MSYFIATLGGVLIGVASAIVFIALGKGAGISGIANVFVAEPKIDWRVAFAAGLIATGGVASLVYPAAFSAPTTGVFVTLLAGFLVGFGSRYGNGCTSGHGVCGVARLSRRSIIATLVFISTGAITVFFTQGVFA